MHYMYVKLTKISCQPNCFTPYRNLTASVNAYKTAEASSHNTSARLDLHCCVIAKDILSKTNKRLATIIRF